MESTIPQSVREQGEAADELLKQQQPGTGQDGEEVAADPTESGLEQPAGTLPPATPNDFKVQYEVLQGKYNAEVPRLHGEVLGLRQLVTDLTKTLGSVQAPAAAPPKVEETPEGLAYIRQELPALEDAMKYLINQEVQTLIGDKIKEVNANIETVHQTSKSTAEGMFWKSLGDRVPNWEQINADPHFLSWLEQPDRYFGVKKVDLLRQAAGSLNLGVTSNFFEDFLREAGVAPASAPKSKNKFVAPTASRAGTPPVAPDGYLSTRDIAKFYEDITRGVYTGRDADRAAQEASINKALAEGRIAR